MPKQSKHRCLAALAVVLGLALVAGVAGPAAAQEKEKGEGKKPNILFIMGDDIGIWNIGAYHRGMMAGRTPNLDKLAGRRPTGHQGGNVLPGADGRSPEARLGCYLHETGLEKNLRLGVRVL